MVKCYFVSKEVDENGERIKCRENAYPDSCWCSRTHQLEWQKENYGRTDERRTPYSIEEIQKKILIMKQKQTAKLL